MKFGQIIKSIEKFTIDNSPLILTVIGVTGTITTAILTGKASYKAAKILGEESPFLKTTEKMRLVWPLYISAIGTGAMTLTCIIAANRIGTRRAAAMAAAYSVSERMFGEYRDKVVEKMGANKEREARDEVAQDRIRENPVGKTEVIITGGGDVRCYDMYTGRYFHSDMETLRQAQNDLNHQLLNASYASLNDFYSLIGLSTTKTGEEVGWNSDKLLELQFSATIAEDGKPCIAIDFQVAPIRNYFRVH